MKYTKSFPELLQRASFSHLSHSDFPPNDLQMWMWVPCFTDCPRGHSQHRSAKSFKCTRNRLCQSVIGSQSPVFFYIRCPQSTVHLDFLFVCFCLEIGSHYRTACLPWGLGVGEGWERLAKSSHTARGIYVEICLYCNCLVKGKRIRSSRSSSAA